MPEKTMDEKQAQPQQPAPAPKPADKTANFRLFAQGFVVVMGLAWAMTIAFALSQFSWTGSASVKIGRVGMSPGGLAAGALAGAAIIGGILKKQGDKLTPSRPGLGRAVRTTAYVSIAALTAYGAYALYMAPTLTSPWWQPIAGPFTLMGKEASLRPILFPALGVFMAVMSGVFLILNREASADFLVETEGEIKKVSWPARKEYVGSAMIVVLVVAVTSGFLHFVDLYLSKLMQYLGVGF